MTRFSSWACRISLLYLLVGFTLGAMLLADKATPLWPWIVVYLPVHYEVLLMGWLMNMIFGVAYWLFPRFTPGEDDMKSRGYENAAWVALAALNTGILLFVASHLFSLPRSWTLAGRLLETVGIVAFLVNAFPRIKPVKET